MLIFRPLIRPFDFAGRATRAEYWLYLILQTAVVGGCIVASTGALAHRDLPQALAGMAVWLAAAGLAWVLLGIPYSALLSRRLHDTGRSAWWMLLIVPGYLSAFQSIAALIDAASRASAAGAGPRLSALDLLSPGAGGAALDLIVPVCGLILGVITLLPGQRGPNRFGPDPLDPHAAGDPAASPYDEGRLEVLFAEVRRDIETAGASSPDHVRSRDFDGAEQAAVRAFGRRGA